MKILLVGEYSRLHNSLKKGLSKLNHNVTLVSCGDDFKNYPSDFYIKAPFFKKYFFLNIIFRGLRKFHIINLEKIEIGIRAYTTLKKLNKFDIVQLINITSFNTYPFIEKKNSFIIKKTKRQTFFIICRNGLL